MQEKRNKRLAILLVVLLGTTASVYWFGKYETGYEVDPAMFKQVDLNTVDEVVLESSSGKIDLKYEGARWKVNEKFNANSDRINVLFATLQQAEAKRPVALSLQDSLSAVLQETGVKVSLRTAGEVNEVFYAGGNGSKNQAYFLQENTTVPYIVTIPGYRVYVSGIFELAESEWRDKYVFGFNWRNFQRLETRFPTNPANDFVVEMDNGLPVLRGIQEVDTTKLNSLLDDISLLMVDDFRPANSSLDSLAKTGPIVSVLVLDIGGREYRLQLYRGDDNSRDYFGIINGTQWARFDTDKIAAIVRGRNFFRKPR
ncbi:MAG TPA: DUF4340 domain-containing protein [Chryseolinea sp.]|nr:DUF4340 domain-containing protein [Chryseolinea sp.]